MRFVFLLAAIGFAAAISSSALRADDIYVNNEFGDDKFNGKPSTDATASSGPVRTIGRALLIAKQGDLIIIQKTAIHYSESISLQGVRHSGTDYLPFRIVSDGAVLDGTSGIDARAWQHVKGNVFRFMPRLKSFQQLFLDGKPAERVLKAQPSKVPELNAQQWCLVDGWVYFCTDAKRIPTQYDLRYCKHQTGITLYDVHNVVIDGLIVQGFQLDGINAHDGVEKTEIQNCKLRGNGRSGLSVGGASRVRLTTSVVGGNGGPQVRSEGSCRLGVQDCRLLESTTTGPALLQEGGRISVDGRDFQAALAFIRRKP